MLAMHQSREAHHTAPLHYSPEGLVRRPTGSGGLRSHGMLGAAVALHGIEEGCGHRPLCGRVRHQGAAAKPRRCRSGWYEGSSAPRIATATWANDVPMETVVNRPVPMACGPNVDQARIGWAHAEAETGV
jgi:hypothetical protein